MKKLMIIPALLLTIGLAVPATSNANNAQKAVANVQSDVTYEDVDVKELPEAINKSFKNDYTGYEIDKAQKGSDGNYKLDVSNENSAYVFYYDGNGRLVKTERGDKKSLNTNMDKSHNEMNKSDNEMNKSHNEMERKTDTDNNQNEEMNNEEGL